MGQRPFIVVVRLTNNSDAPHEFRHFHIVLYLLVDLTEGAGIGSVGGGVV